MTVAVVTGAASGMGRASIETLRGIADVIVAADLTAPDIDGTVGVACDVADPEAVAALATRARELGPFRALAHAAGISPTMGDARRMFEVDLVGTQLLLDAFEDLVVPGSAAVCFSSSSAYQVAPFVTADHEALLRDPLAPDFLDRAVEAATDNSGFAYALAKVGVIRAAATGRGSMGPHGWSRQLGRAGPDRHTDGPPGARGAADHAGHVREHPPRTPRRAGRGRGVRWRTSSPTTRRSSRASTCSSTAACSRVWPSPKRADDLVK